MIAWPILAAAKSKLFDDILVSTEDDEIAETAIGFGAQAPFRRPLELADDHTPTLPVIAHAINWYEDQVCEVDLVCCLYATSPFVRPEYLQQGFEILQRHKDAEFAFSVTTFAYPIFRSLKMREDDTLAMFWPEHELTRSQDLPEAWHDAGQFYWGWKKPFLSHPSVMSGRSYPVPLPRSIVHDIDTLEDWTEAELVFQTWQHSLHRLGE